MLTAHILVHLINSDQKAFVVSSPRYPYLACSIVTVYIAQFS